MTKAKKAISIILAAVMLATMFAFGSLAVEPGNATFTVTPSATNVEVNDTVTVTVKVTTYYYASSIGVPVHFDNSLFDYVPGSLKTNADLYGVAGSADYRVNKDEDIAATGCITLGFAPLSEVAGAKATQLTDVTLFTFQLKAKANGVSPIELKAEDQKTEANITGKLYCGQQPTPELDFTKTILVGQTFTLNNTSVTIGSAAAPELVAKAETTGFVDSANKYVYGVAVGTTAADYFEATNGGTLEWAVGAASSVDGTGATVTLKDASGAVVDTYTLIVFGDVNGDGTVTAADYIAVKDVVLGASIEGPFAVAADVDGSGTPAEPTISAADYIAVKDCVLGADLSVNPFSN